MKTTKPQNYESLLQCTRDELDEYQAQRPWRYKYPNLAERFVIRCVRVAAGVVILMFAIGAFIKLASYSDMKLAALTLSDFAVIIVMPFLTYFLAKWSYVMAFGEGPTRQEIELSRRREAEAKLRELMPEIERYLEQ